MLRKLLFIFITLASYTTHPFSFTEWFTGKSTDDRALVHPKVKVIKNLVLPEMKEQQIITSYCILLFINNDLTAIKPLIKAINKYGHKNVIEVYATIITWALENGYDNVDLFIKKMSHRTLNKKYQDHSLRYYIFIQAITNNSNDVVELLLPKLPSRVIIEKDNNNMTPMEYASAADNQEAITLLSEKIQKIEQERKEGWSWLGAICAGITYGFVRAAIEPDIYVVRPVYRPIIIV